MLLIHGSHSTADAGPISSTIASLQRARVRVSAVSLPGEVYVVSRTARETGGSCVVPESVEHLRAAVLAHCKPPPRRADEAAADAEGRTRMIAMGFPRLVHGEEGLCACHGELRPRGFICPRCGARMCELPSTCGLCRLQLVSAPALARSYHHLFPVAAFVEVPDAIRPGSLHQIEPSCDAASLRLSGGRGGVSGDTGSGAAGDAFSDADALQRTRTGATTSVQVGMTDGSDTSEAQAAAAAPPALATRAPQTRAPQLAEWTSPFNAGVSGAEGSAATGHQSKGGAASVGAAAGHQSSGGVGQERSSHDGAVQQERFFHDASHSCGACSAALGEREARFVCPSCRTAVCGLCEQLIHDTLHSCPGCVGIGSRAEPGA